MQRKWNRIVMHIKVLTKVKRYKLNIPIYVSLINHLVSDMADSDLCFLQDNPLFR